MRPSSIWSWIPPTRVATTGRPFHIASATVSPKPSARLFWATTSARRCSALTITAFSSASSIGSSARWTRRRTPRGSSCHAASASANTSAPSGSSATARTSGPASRRCGSSSRVHVLGERGQHAERILEPVPARHLRDQRAVEAQLVLLDHLRRPLDEADAAVEALEDRRDAAGGGPAARPAARSTAVTLVNAIAWFFGENASIDGGMTVTRPRSRPSQVNASRENTYASAGSHVGR